MRENSRYAAFGDVHELSNFILSRMLILAIFAKNICWFSRKPIYNHVYISIIVISIIFFKPDSSVNK